MTSSSQQPLDVSLLNEKQLKVYNTVIHNNNTSMLRLIVYGSAGTGKSYLIRCLQSYLGNRVILTAPTGVAAFNIQGSTIHSIFQLPVKKPFTSLKGDLLENFQNLMKNVDFLIIDEISMVGLKCFDQLTRRLNQINKTNISIILFGDYNQLSPVNDFELFNQGNMSTILGRNLYMTFQKCIFLNENMRQTGDDDFKALLQRIRNGCIQYQDWTQLMTRHASNVTNLNEFENAVEIYTTRKAVQIINYNKLRDLGNPIRVIRAFHGGPGKPETAPTDLAGGLEATLELAVECRVMLIANIMVESGLYNGAMGTVKSIKENVIIVHFDHLEKGEGEEGIHITRKVYSWKYMNEQDSSFRKQFPLKLCYALTVHKSQGLTLDRVKLNLGIREFCTGLTYVALSRVRRLQDIIISGCSYKRLQQLKANKFRDLEECRLRQMEI